MLVIITSPAAIQHGQAKPDSGVVRALIDASKAGNPVGVVSNNPKPIWFDAAFAGTDVEFVQFKGRQSGQVITKISELFKKPTFDILVLAGSLDDIMMAKNGGAVLIGAGWSTDQKVRGLGINIKSPAELLEVIELTEGWMGSWWYQADEEKYGIRALLDLSSYGRDDAQVVFAKKLTATVKNGGNRLTALLIVCARSLLIEGVGSYESLFWSVYPSSNSANDDTDVLSYFTHRLRTTVSKVQVARYDEPLFIRHKPSVKRSLNRGGDRTDPINQIVTLHLNPAYRKTIKDRIVVVIDDCTTYGVSFGVAAAFLKKAGASSVLGVALGKFGGAINYFDIEISTDPFEPIGPDGFEVIEKRHMNGITDRTAQEILRRLIP